jgi:hypothetical protein
MVMHSSDGTFCKTLDRGVELWLLDPQTEPCRRMAESAALLVDEVLPHEPISL